MDIYDVNISSEIEEKLKQYQALLVKWQKKINLVSPNTINESWERHFIDSMQVEPLVPNGAKTIFDLGCGAGFPGLVLAMMRPDLDIHLIESDQKKCAFLKSVSRETKTPTQVHNARIEHVEIDAIPDVVTARALASLVNLFDYCEGWVSKNPELLLIFPKGARSEEELAALEKKWKFNLCTCPSVTSEESKILIFSDTYRV
jgi:16S rRNA (guanine527-N7)-methyltransferase